MNLPWRTALIPLLRKYIADKFFSASLVHTPVGLSWLSLTPQGCMDREEFALMWAASVIFTLT